MTSYSRTAEFMALFRALESARRRRLFTDPWASRFLSQPLRAIAALASFPPVNSAVSAFIDRRWPGARASGVARTRYLDDALRDAVREGAVQVVILGAGFDSRARRLPGIAGLQVFEVDHPDTSRTKQELLRRSPGGLPSHVAFVSIDFNREKLAAAMHRAGLDLAKRTVFLWEGVTNYLNDPAVDATFRYIATAASHSRVLFTYVHRDVLRQRSAFVGTSAVRALVQAVREPWTFGFDPADLPEYLEARGLRLISDIGAAQYRALYLGDRERRPVGYEFYRIAVAEVTDQGVAIRPTDDTPRDPGEPHAQG